VDQWVGLEHQSMNSDTERGGTHQGVGIRVNQDEGETKTRGEGIDNIYSLFFLERCTKLCALQDFGTWLSRFEGYGKF
jgi:hypothetical protein